jgi:hypothetical protein
MGTWLQGPRKVIIVCSLQEECGNILPTVLLWFGILDEGGGGKWMVHVADSEEPAIAKDIYMHQCSNLMQSTIMVASNVMRKGLSYNGHAS